MGSLPTTHSKEEKHMQALSKSSRPRPCPPHTPLLTQRTEDGYRVVRCLVCGLLGPKREDGSRARLAFDESSKPLE
jgi:hypothetical protein